MLLASYAFTLALSAFLLFWVQPLVGKIILAPLGGASQVWITVMLFFQSSLLLGYSYAHCLQRFCRLRTQVIVHGSLFFLACLSLPFTLSTERWFSVIDQPIFQILQALSVEIAAVVILLSASAPLLQSWFFHSRHQRAHDPYFLYVSSNAGSLLAVLLFPFVIEPWLGIQRQITTWQVSCDVLFIVLVICALQVSLKNTATIKPEKLIAPDWKQAGLWLLLSFVPCSLLMCTSNFITQDIAPVPLLWVVPLGLYLLTFMLAFSRNPIIKPRLILAMQEYGIVPLLILFLFPTLHLGGWGTLLTVLVCFYICAQACHFQLAACRPHGQYLTTFYWVIAFGGFLAGLFNGIIAPLIFNQLYEFPISLLLCAALLPYGREHYFRLQTIDLLPLLFVIVCAAIGAYYAHYQLPYPNYLVITVLGVALLYALTAVKRPLHFTLTLCAVFLGFLILQPHHIKTLYRERNFYGQYAIQTSQYSHVLMSGKTVHGAQVLGDKTHRLATTYYHVVEDMLAGMKKSPKNIAVIGLGTGTVACLVDKKDHVTFYELDPSVARMAMNPSYFTYLQSCPPKGGIVIGDGRLQIKKSRPHQYDLIILDAFSSDSIPTHLLTLEAFELYLSKLSKTGIIAVHISNRYVDLSPVLNTLAARLSLEHANITVDNHQGDKIIFASRWTLLSRDMNNLEHIKNISLSLSPPNGPLWTDDFSNILSVLN